uniref:LHFPL tetraspan subfamily member 5a n=1 Tax=Eptatretus burgeri TaxID=7764 RepID=A0A8C4QD64_EPTBU
MLDVSNAAVIYHSSYVRNARAIGVLWAVLTLCFAVLCVVSFIQPFWIGDSDRSPQAGHFGLARYCLGNAVTQGLVCHGGFLDFSAVPSGAFKTAAFFVGTAMLLVLTSLVCLSLFFFCTAAAVYKVCAWLQLAYAISDQYENYDVIHNVCLKKKKPSKVFSEMAEQIEGKIYRYDCLSMRNKRFKHMTT